MRYVITARDQDVSHVALSGDLTDSVDVALSNLAGEVSTPKVSLDLGAVGAINSVGIAAWTRFIAALEAKATIELTQVPSLLIFFAGQMSRFFGRSVVRSLYMPCFCEGCQKSQAVLIDAAALTASRAVGTPACPTCGSAMEPEVDPEEFTDAALRCVGAA